MANFGTAEVTAYRVPKLPAQKLIWEGRRYDILCTLFQALTPTRMANRIIRVNGHGCNYSGESGLRGSVPKLLKLWVQQCCCSQQLVRRNPDCRKMMFKIFLRGAAWTLQTFLSALDPLQAPSFVAPTFQPTPVYGKWNELQLKLAIKAVLIDGRSKKHAAKFHGIRRRFGI